MKVLGIDPGTNLLGMGIIEEDRKGMRCVAAGLLDLRKQDRKKVGQVIYQAISFVIAEYHPDALAIEDRNVARAVHFIRLNALRLRLRKLLADKREKK